MSIKSYLVMPGSKYLIIGKTVWEQDELAKSIAPEPRFFTLNGTEYVVLSLDPLAVPQLEAYIVSQGGNYEFGFVQGNGKASFLLHSEVLAILNNLDSQE